MANARISAIILTYSNPENIPRIVDILRPQGCEIIVADDGLPGFVPPVGVKHYTHPRMGMRPSTCRNEGARLATGNLLLFVDDDCIPTPDLVAEHEKCLADYDVSIGLTPTDLANKRSDVRLGAYENEVAPLHWMTHSGNLAVRREAFWKVGGFDDHTFNGDYAWEDTDIGLRLHNADCRLKLNRWAVAHHLGIPQEKADPKRSAVNFDKFQAKRQRSKRVLVISSGHMVSTLDVFTGWTRALHQMGHKVLAYNYHSRIQFFNTALTAWREATGTPFDTGKLTELASEGLPATVLDFVPEAIVVICGLVLHPKTLPLLRKLRVPTVAVLTESPYSDENQARLIMPWVDIGFANDKSSLERLNAYGKAVYCPHSFDPWVHYPQEVGKKYRHGIFFFGTLYPERRELFNALEVMDWAGVNVSIAGTRIDKDTGDVYVEKAVGQGLRCWQPNSELVRHYAGSKISIQLHRTTADYFKGTVIGEDAYSLGPRAFEIPASGGFMVSDDSRPELREVYGETVPTFRTAGELQGILRYYLGHEEDRKALAELQRVYVQPCSFRERAETVVWPEVEKLLCP